MRRHPDLDLIRIQDAGLTGAAEPAVLEWAARENRLLLTHDVTTITRHAYARAAAGEPMPGVIEVSRAVPLARPMEDILLLAELSREGEWEGQILYLPLR